MELDKCPTGRNFFSLVVFPFKVFFPPSLVSSGLLFFTSSFSTQYVLFCTLNRPLEEVVLSSFLQRLVLASEIDSSDGVFSS